MSDAVIVQFEVVDSPQSPGTGDITLTHRDGQTTKFNSTAVMTTEVPEWHSADCDNNNSAWWDWFCSARGVELELEAEAESDLFAAQADPSTGTDQLDPDQPQPKAEATEDAAAQARGFIKQSAAVIKTLAPNVTQDVLKIAFELEFNKARPRKSVLAVLAEQNAHFGQPLDTSDAAFDETNAQQQPVEPVQAAKPAVEATQTTSSNWTRIELQHGNDKPVTKEAQKFLEAIGKGSFDGALAQIMGAARERSDFLFPPRYVNDHTVGRVLKAIKRHQGRNTAWGRCHYEVTCVEHGGFELTTFVGNRKDLKVGQRWNSTSDMFVDLLGLRGKDGKRTRHPQMTLKRYFSLD